MNPRFILWIYIALSLTHVVAHLIPSEELQRFTKPLLMPLLIFYVYRSSLGKTTAKTLLLSGALFFSWLGDVVLIYTGEGYFRAGIGLFLIAQLLYVYILLKSSYQRPQFDILKAIPFVFYAALLFYLLLPAGDFSVPIIIYGLVIMVMAIMARYREGNTSDESYKLALLGSVFFLLSDSILAYDSFKSAIPYSGAFIMATYCAAQLMLMQGILRHVD